MCHALSVQYHFIKFRPVKIDCVCKTVTFLIALSALFKCGLNVLKNVIDYHLFSFISKII